MNNGFGWNRLPKSFMGENTVFLLLTALIYYYVTMILKLLAQVEPGCVFKGGTSLSKCHHVIDRFSEDIDITFSNTLTQKVELTLCR